MMPAHRAFKSHSLHDDMTASQTCKLALVLGGAENDSTLDIDRWGGGAFTHRSRR
ncbi:unnamed protein product [Ectocarpus sp. 6 AP-2014]